jgi:hypothetical protein
MPRYPYLADIEIARLRLDLKNPRLSSQPDSQHQAFRAMAEVQGPKLVALAKHIAVHGLNPAQPFVVIPDDDNQFIVLDANRRLTALRVLEQPDLLSDQMKEAEVKAIKLAAERYAAPEDVPCVIFERREDADLWVELQHDGERDGAGLVGWSAQQKARHRARGGAQPQHLQVLDFVREAGTLSAATRVRCDSGSYPVSTLERALSTPRVRKRLGIDLVAGKVMTDYPRAQILRGLTRLVDDIGTGAIKVGALMTLADRTKYIDGFPSSDVPDPATRLGDTAILTEAPETFVSPVAKARDRPPSNVRTKLIPTQFSISVKPARINDIYLELKRKLKVDDVPNAAGVLLRVFLELSVDDYLERESVAVPKDPTLANKVGAAADHLEAVNAITGKQLIPVREAVKSPDKLTLATNLNALIHNRQMTVSGNDLKALWDRLELFFERIWA